MANVSSATTRNADFGRGLEWPLVRNKTLARTLEKVHVLEGWGSGFQRINTMCQEYGVALPEFTEIGDMFRVNFYRRQNSEIGDKSAIKSKIGDKFQENDCRIPC